MDAHSIDRLEQLARLKASGSLSAAEFELAKAALLNGGTPPAAPPPAASAAAAAPTPTVGNAELSATWRRRFEFLTDHGMPNSAKYRTAYRALPWGERVRVSFSFLGLLLGPIYLLYLGLWRAAVSMSALAILLSLLLAALGFSDRTDRAMQAGFAALFATTCVPLYYLKVTRGMNPWNPWCWLR